MKGEKGAVRLPTILVLIICTGGAWRGFQARFPPAVANRLLLSTLTAAIKWPGIDLWHNHAQSESAGPKISWRQAVATLGRPHGQESFWQWHLDLRIHAERGECAPGVDAQRQAHAAQLLRERWQAARILFPVQLQLARRGALALPSNIVPLSTLLYGGKGY